MSARTLRRICWALALGVAAPGAVLAQGIQILDAWSRPTPPGMDVGVAYFTIRNPGKSDRLLGVSTPRANRAEMHVSIMKDGVMKMQPLGPVDIGSGATTSFEPSARHVMLLGLKRALKEGEAFPLVLTFANAGPVSANVRVRGSDGMAKDHPSPMKH